MGKTDGIVRLSTKLDTSGLKSAGIDIKAALAKTSTAVLAFGAAVATAIGAAVKQSVEAYADYEQLVGGVETLFKDSADKVMQYAEQAYKTAGVSANQYMETVTSFSASLISSLGGDTSKAADIANTALVAMADNANKMGSSLESIQTAYQGFAKGQYQLLDNLKLGYGGTKTEMERLLKDAEAFSGVKYDINNLGDVYEAINQIQIKLDIAGATAKEAATTISGSGQMAKSAWQNVLTAIAGGGSLDKAIENFVDSFEKYFDNITPAVERSLAGVGQLIERIGPKAMSMLTKAIVEAAPGLIAAINKMVIGLAKGVVDGIKQLFVGGAKEVLEEQAEIIENAAENQKDLTKEVKKTANEAKKAVAGFDELNVLSAGEEESTQSDANTASSGTSSIIQENSEVVKAVDSNLAAIMMTIGTALTAIGVILIFSGNVVLGIAFVAAGASEFGIGAASIDENNVSKTVASSLIEIMAVISGALVAIGVILIMVGSVGLGIGFIVAGAASLGATIYSISAFSADPIKDTLLAIEAIAGGAMLALGILLLYFGVNKALAIGLIVAGSAVLAVAAAQIVAGAVSEEIAAWIYGITAIVSTALLVIGVIMLCCGIITPLSIGLVLAGAAGLASTIAINKDAIVGWVKSVWESVKSFWNKYIAPVFTGKFWADLAKTAGNGLISGFEFYINGIISLWEMMINWIVGGLNKISFDVPDWVPLIGGKKFGFNIPEVKFGRVSIPRLAQGAVIPPNKEFMAVLGDQKHGTNIEAPLETIKQALAEVMALQGGGNETIVSVNFTGDLAQLARVLKPAIDTETRRKGGSLAKVGAF